jgi:3-methyladenine DNA glycosylase AlkD
VADPIPSPAPTELAARLEERLRAQGTAQRAVGAKAYLKSELEFLGVDTESLRREVKRLLREAAGLDRAGLLALVEGLWGRGVFELRAGAVELLTMRVELLEARDLGFLERLIRDSGTWALVDALAPSVAGPLVEREEARHPEIGVVLDRWAADEDFWVRRAALLVYLLPLRRGAGDFERFARYADAMLEERELFIRKAIGWVLREVGKKRPALATRWLLGPAPGAGTEPVGEELASSRGGGGARTAGGDELRPYKRKGEPEGERERTGQPRGASAHGATVREPRAAIASGVTVREAVKYLPAEDREAILAAYRSGR